MAVLETIHTLKDSFLDTSTVIALTVFFTLLCLCIIIGHLLEEHRWANESITALLLVGEFCTLYAKMLAFKKALLVSLF